MDGTELTGVMCATVTPVGADGFAVDWDGMAANAGWLVDMGVDILVVNGSIGEYAAISDADRRRAVEHTVATVAGQARVVAGCSHNSPQQAVDLCHHAEQAGADAVMVMAPSYFRLRDDCVVEFFAYLAERISLPFLVYNNPTISGSDLGVAAVEAVAELPGCLGLKEASGRPGRHLELLTRFGDELPVIAANESCLYSALTAGTKGCMTASAAFAPQLLRAMVDAAARGDLANARREWARLAAFRDLMQTEINAGVPAYIPYTKAAMNLLGLHGGRPHFPLRQLGEDETTRLRQVLTSAMGLQPVGGAGAT